MNIFKKKLNIFLLFLIILVIIIVIFNHFPSKNIENFQKTSDAFTTYNNSNLYDEFYTNMYDKLVFSEIKK
jgi:uncharacterized protein (UPF0333 family)